MPKIALSRPLLVLCHLHFLRKLCFYFIFSVFETFNSDELVRTVDMREEIHFHRVKKSKKTRKLRQIRHKRMKRAGKK